MLEWKIVIQHLYFLPRDLQCDAKKLVKIVARKKPFLILRNVMSNTFGIWKKLTSGKLFFIHLKRSAFQRCNGYSILFKHQKRKKKQQQHGDCAKYIERLIIQAFFVHQLNNKNVLLVALDFLGTKDL